MVLTPNITEPRGRVLQDDGKIHVAGESGFYGNINMRVMRYNSDGSQDVSFSDDGAIDVDLAAINAWIEDIGVRV